MIKEKQSRRKKQFRAFKWNYFNRPVLLEQFVGDEGYIHLKYGNYFECSIKDYSTRKISKIQKQLRQYLYNYLAENNLPTTKYILNVDCPDSISRDKVFLELQLYCPTSKVNLEANKGFCEMLINKMMKDTEKVVSG